MRKIAVQDACILIDLTDLKILRDILKLPYEFVCTDLVLQELRSDQREIIQDHRIPIISLTESELIFLFEELRKSPGLTAPDLSCLLLTKKENGILLTGDGALRKKAKHSDIEAHGILWLLDQLIEEQIWNSSIAHRNLEQLIHLNHWLPSEECEARLRKWKKL